MSDFVRPEVTLGQTVLWYDDVTGNSKPYSALVTDVGEQTIALTAFGPGYHNGHPSDGVYHRNDPRCRKEGNRDSGVWEHTEYTKMIERLRDRIFKQPVK